MPKWIYDAIRPTGSQRPQMYDLPKTHKEGMPLRLILSMTGSSHCELGKLAHYNLCWSGFRHIAFQIRLRLQRSCKILTSTLMSSCVLLMCPACSPTFPLMKPSKSVQMPFITILIHNHSFQGMFVELMKSATSSVEFSFNNTMYKQTDGVAMGSSLGPALANIVVEYHEEKLFSQT